MLVRRSPNEAQPFAAARNRENISEIYVRADLCKHEEREFFHGVNFQLGAKLRVKRAPMGGVGAPRTHTTYPPPARGATCETPNLGSLVLCNGDGGLNRATLEEADQGLERRCDEEGERGARLKNLS